MGSMDCWWAVPVPVPVPGPAAVQPDPGTGSVNGPRPDGWDQAEVAGSGSLLGATKEPKPSP